MSTEKSFSLADSFSQQVEEIENLPEVEAFKREIKFTYARMVKEEKNNEIVEGENQGNPLIAQVKDYVFHHLHGGDTGTGYCTGAAGESGLSLASIQHQ